MQSRLARQRIHQHTRAHETAVPSLPWDLDVEAEGVVYPALPLHYQLAPILSTKDSTFLIDKRRKGYINATHLPKRHRGEEECNEHGCKNKEGETEAGRGGQSNETKR